MMPIFWPQPFAACKDMHDDGQQHTPKQGAPRRVQVPSHVLRVFSDDAGQEKVEIQVDLPGVSKASDISVRIEPPDTVQVSVPQRYALLLKLSVPVAARADTVRFKSRSSRLTMSCLVVSPAEAAALRAAATAAEAEAPTADAPDVAAGAEQPDQHLKAAASQHKATAGQPAPTAQQEAQPGAAPDHQPSPARTSGVPQPAASSAVLQTVQHCRSPESAAAVPPQQPVLPAALPAQQQAVVPASAAEEQQQQRKEELLGRAFDALERQDLEEGAKALQAALLIDPTSSQATRLLQRYLLPAVQWSTATQQQQQQQQQQQPEAADPPVPAAAPAAAGTSAATAAEDAFDRKWAEYVEGVQRGIVQAEELHDHLCSGRSPLTAEFVAKALQLKQQMICSHAPNLVGWWCSLLDFCSFGLWSCCLHAARWAGGIRAEGMWGCGHLMGYLDELFQVLCFCPYFLHVTWSTAWSIPHTVLWFALPVLFHFTAAVCTGNFESVTIYPTLSAVVSNAAASGRYLASTEAARPAAIKLLLASCTVAVGWLLLWLAWQLLGLLWALACGVFLASWWLLCWPWLNLVWRPDPNLQVGVAGGVAWLCSCERWASVGCFNFTMVVVQAAMSGGHLRTVGSFLVSLLWLHYTTYWRGGGSSSTGGSSGTGMQQQQPPWWKASLVGLAYPVARTWLGRAGVGWLLELPNYAVAVVARGAFELCWGLADWYLGLVALTWRLVQWPLICIIACLGTACLLVYESRRVIGPGADSSMQRCVAWVLLPARGFLTGITHLLRPVGMHSRCCVSWVVECASSLLIRLLKPWVLLPSSLLWYGMLLLMPQLLLERMSLRFCGAQSGSAVMREACGTVGSVQHAGKAQDGVHLVRSWWGDLMLLAGMCIFAYVAANWEGGGSHGIQASEEEEDEGSSRSGDTGGSPHQSDSAEPESSTEPEGSIEHSSLPAGCSVDAVD